MIVISLFDGESGGQIAFERLGILFDGVKISSYYKPPIDTLPNFYKKNDKDLDINNFKSKVGVKVDFTRYYRDKLTNLNWESRGTDR